MIDVDEQQREIRIIFDSMRKQHAIALAALKQFEVDYKDAWHHWHAVLDKIATQERK